MDASLGKGKARAIFQEIFTVRKSRRQGVWQLPVAVARVTSPRCWLGASHRIPSACSCSCMHHAHAARIIGRTRRSEVVNLFGSAGSTASAAAEKFLAAADALRMRSSHATLLVLLTRQRTSGSSTPPPGKKKTFKLILVEYDSYL